jgi:GDPmannose 4,6-dehydratase
MPIALITGIAGQDGSYLAEYLLEQGYEVHGIVRRNSIPEHQESRISHLGDAVRTHYADVNDEGSLWRLLDVIAPSEVYNLAAQSHVRISFEIPKLTTIINSAGTLNILEILRISGSKAKFYQASSSEMFGDSVDLDNYQRETTPMHPVSPYGCSKLFSYHIVRNYRKAYGLFAANGILFNHESPRRGSNFVTSKVVKAAVEIKLGMRDSLVMGNLDSQRDWGHSADYVRAMQAILQANQPDDWVVATGETKSVREMLEFVFSYLGLNYADYVRQDKKYLRPEELPYLRGDSTKIRKELGWRPNYSFESLMTEMIENWLTRLTRVSR